MLSLEYVAGLLDGDGHISLGGQGIIKKDIRYRDQTRLIDRIAWNRRIGITNTYLPVLEELRKDYGGDIYKIKRDNTLWKEAYGWRIHGEKSVIFLKKLYPYLIIKEKQAEVYLKFSKTTRTQIRRRHITNDEITKLKYDLYQELISLNSRGMESGKVGKITLPESIKPLRKDYVVKNRMGKENSYHVNMISPKYIAGLLDSEGFISINGKQYNGTRINGRGQTRMIDFIRWTLRIGITNTYYPLIWMLKEQFNGNIQETGGHKSSLKYKQAYQWIISSRASFLFLKEIYPYLIIKKERADVYVKFMETQVKSGNHTLPDEVIKLRYELYQKMIGLNSRGTGDKRIGKLTLPKPRFKIIYCTDCGKERKITWGKKTSGANAKLCIDCLFKQIREGKIVKKRDKKGRFIC